MAGSKYALKDLQWFQFRTVDFLWSIMVETRGFFSISQRTVGYFASIWLIFWANFGSFYKLKRSKNGSERDKKVRKVSEMFKIITKLLK